jgi:hypothetical protein
MVSLKLQQTHCWLYFQFFFARLYFVKTTPFSRNLHSSGAQSPFNTNSHAAGRLGSGLAGRLLPLAVFLHLSSFRLPRESIDGDGSLGCYPRPDLIGNEGI